MTDTIASRLAHAIKARRLDMKSASLKAGLGETYVRDVIKRGLNPTASALLKLSDAMNVRSEWLLTGAGDFDLGGEPKFTDFMNLFNKLNNEQQEAVMTLLQSMAEKELQGD